MVSLSSRKKLPAESYLVGTPLLKRVEAVKKFILIKEGDKNGRSNAERRTRAIKRPFC